MALQAPHLAHAFRHDRDPRAIVRPTLDDATGASSVFNGGPAKGSGQLPAQLQSRGNTVFSDPLSELICKNNNGGSGCCFVPRKRARVADDAGLCSLITEGHGGALAFTSGAGDVQRRDHGCSTAASTSGRPAASQGLLSQLHRHGVEIDALVRVENERLRAGLEEARLPHMRTVVSALERAAARRLRTAETDLSRALARGAELEEKLRQVAAEGQAWQGVASGHEAAAAGLRATIEQLLLQAPPCAESGAAVAEDAQSCCVDERGRAADRDGGGAGRRACRSCGAADACVLLLPCRHLCLCARCEAAVDACPVCAAAKNASLRVLLH